MDTRVHHELVLSGVPEGLDALVLARLTQRGGIGHGRSGFVLHIARDDRRLDALQAALTFFDPKVRVIAFPAWDTVPFDRVGTNAEIVAKRMNGIWPAGGRVAAASRR